MVLAQVLLNKEQALEQEKENFVKAFKILKETSTENLNKDCTENAEIDVASNETSNATDTKLELQENSKLWTEESTLNLISLCKKYDKDFEKGVKKYIWIKIAKTLSETYQQIYTAQQCDTKFKALKNMYKQIRKHNEQSGNNKKSWKYFEQMHDILFSKPEITPYATCSSKSGLIVGGTPISNIKDTDTSSSSSNMCETHQSTSSFSRKRKRAENATEKRHQDKMARQDRYLDLLERLTKAVEKSSDDI
ncbi:uncharacterized protein LOC108915663 [Anoplophora glabripennis]|uniref:uncharacterized protein LOC108915663 n=1 Tax=Anoplophora glabripennis TaxID=217634 RepID=UPI0008757BB2|nr:uncharacterized protein LOC108915663 [Anoplophora glabripennis]